MGVLPAPPRSDERHEALVRYVEEIRGLLGLGHWTIRLPDEWPNEEDVNASMTLAPGRYVATLRFGEGFWTLNRDDTRNVVVHEVLHLAHARLSEAVRGGEYRQSLSQALYDHFNDQLATEAEYMVDLLAEALGPLMPLPPDWPD